MNRARLCSVILALLAFTPAPGAELISWNTDHQAAVLAAQNEQRLLLVHFWTPDCAPCRRVEKSVFSRPQVAQVVHQNFVPVKVNAYDAPELCARYRVDRWPTDVIVTADGEIVHSMVTPQDPNKYVYLLSEIAMQFARRARQPQNGPLTQAAPATGTSPFNPTMSLEARLSASAETSVSPAVPSDPRDFRQPGAPAGQPNEPAGQPGEVANQFSRGPARGELLAAAPPHRGGPPPQVGQTAAPAVNPNVVNPYLARSPGPAPRAPFQDYPPGMPVPNSGAAASPAGTAPSASFGRDANPVVASGPALPAPPSLADQVAPRNYRPRPDQVSAAGPTTPVRPEEATEVPAVSPTAPLALDGHCPVTLCNEERWAKGDPRFGLVHRGRTYLFASREHLQMFWERPDTYSPILAGMDPVRLLEEGRVVEGDRHYGLVYQPSTGPHSVKQIYLFDGEETLNRFFQDPARYAQPIQQAIQTQSLHQFIRR